MHCIRRIEPEEERTLTCIGLTIQEEEPLIQLQHAIMAFLYIEGIKLAPKFKRPAPCPYIQLYNTTEPHTSTQTFMHFFKSLASNRPFHMRVDPQPHFDGEKLYLKTLPRETNPPTRRASEPKASVSRHAYSEDWLVHTHVISLGQITEGRRTLATRFEEICEFISALVKSYLGPGVTGTGVAHLQIDSHGTHEATLKTMRVDDSPFKPTLLAQDTEKIFASRPIHIGHLPRRVHSEWLTGYSMEPLQ